MNYLENDSIETYSKLFFSSILLFTVLLLFDTANAQIQIKYDNPEIHGRNQSGQQPWLMGKFNDSGILIINKASGTVIMLSEKNNTRRVFDVGEIKYLNPPGHYIGFGSGAAFGFLPNENMITLIYERNRIYNFKVTNSDKERLLRDFKR